jgi:hypothetical protein
MQSEQTISAAYYFDLTPEITFCGGATVASRFLEPRVASIPAASMKRMKHEEDIDG